MATIQPHELQRAVAAITECGRRLIAIRASESALNAPAAMLTDRSAHSLAYALSEASSMYPHAGAWEIIAADEECEEPRPTAADPAFASPGRILRDPVLIATLRTSDLVPSERPVYS